MPKATRTKVAFIIVCWNNRDLLEECLEAVKVQTYPHITTIIVDNGSADDSVALARSLMPEALVIEAGANLGFAKGNNVGIKKALEDPEVGYIALLNSDARLAPDWTEQIVAFAVQKPRSACLQGTTMDYYNHEVVDSTHIFIARNGQGTQGSWRDVYETEFGPRKVFGVNAAAAVITRDFIEAQPFGTQLFDEAMFMYLEDVDLATRSLIMGWDNYLVPAARAYHMGSASSGKNPGFSLYMTFRNNAALLVKNLRMRMVLRMLPKLIRGDLDTLRTLRARGDHAAAKKVIKGRLIGILRVPLYLGKRGKLKAVRDIPEDYLWYLMDRGY